MQPELLNVHDVAKLTGYKCRASIYNLMNNADFPRPVRIGARSVRWMRSEVVAWIESRTRHAGGAQ